MEFPKNHLYQEYVLEQKKHSDKWSGASVTGENPSVNGHSVLEHDSTDSLNGKGEPQSPQTKLSSQRSYEEYLEEIDLQRYWLVVKRRWPIVVVMGLLFLLPAWVFAWWLERLPQEYTATGQLLFQRRNPKSELTGLGQQVGQLDSVGGNPLNTEAAILRSSSLLQETIEALNLRDGGVPVSPGSLKRNLTVQNIERSDILVLSYRSPNSDRSVDVVRALMEQYLIRHGELTRSEVSAAQDFIQAQLPTLEEDVNAATEALRQFKLNNNIISLEQETRVVAERITSLDQETDSIQTQLTVAQTRSTALRNQLGMDPNQALDLAFVTESPGIQQALTDLQTLQSQLVQQRALYTPDHPIVVNLEREVQALDALLQGRIAELLDHSEASFAPSDLHLGSLKQSLANQLIQAEIDRITLASQLQALTELRASYTQRQRELPDLEKQQRELELALNLAQESYQRLLSRLPELVIAQSQSISNDQVKIIENATLLPTPPRSLNRKILAAGVLGGVFMGVSLAFVLEILDRSLKTIKDGEALLEYPLLGAIPEFKTKQERGVDELVSQDVSPRIVGLRSPTSPICESYQMLQAQLRFLGFGTIGRALAVASSISEEGRSEIAANLALTLAQAKRKVLLIDADLRSPSQHLLWKVPNDRGFSDVLGGERKVKPLLHSVTSHLTILPSGPRPDNPFALLDSPYTTTILRAFAKRFDHIILDTPPLMRAPDAALLGQIVNQVLFVVRPKFVEPNTVLDAQITLQKSNVQVLGFVANRIDFSQEHSIHAHYARKHQESDSGQTGMTLPPEFVEETKNVPEEVLS